jgi:hypothetical protein
VWLGEEKSNSDLALDLLAKPVHEAYVRKSDDTKLKSVPIA